MILIQVISNRMRAGALVIVVEEADEVLAETGAVAASQQFSPVRIISASDPELTGAIDSHRTGSGTLIVKDSLRVYGNNPVFVRMIRDIALQTLTRGEGSDFSRLILLEAPGVEIPPVLRGDIEYVRPKLPTIEELKEELEGFLKGRDLKLEGNGENRHAIAAAVSGLSRHEAMRLFGRCYVENGKTLDARWLRRAKAERISEQLGGALTFVDVDVPKVGGLDNLKKFHEDRKVAFGSEKARKYGLPEPKGILLLGTPGCGKSLTAKGLAQDWGVPMLKFDLGRVFGSLVGQSESQVRQAIEAAEACSPRILMIDEIEKGLAGASGASGDSGTTKRVFGTLLSWLQDKTAPVYVVATANRIADLPPELLRKGRFDEIFFVDLPTLEERTEIAKIHVERRGRKVSDINVTMIAKATEGFGGAEIEQAIVDAMFRSFSDNREVCTEDVLVAVKATMPLSKTMESEIKVLRSWVNGRARLASSTVAPMTSGPIRRSSVS